MKHIQVFTKDEEIEEISGQLIELRHKDNWTIIKHKDIGFPEIWENQFPDWNVKMIRISKYER